MALASDACGKTGDTRNAHTHTEASNSTHYDVRGMTGFTLDIRIERSVRMKRVRKWLACYAPNAGALTMDMAVRKHTLSREWTKMGGSQKCVEGQSGGIYCSIQLCHRSRASIPRDDLATELDAYNEAAPAVLRMCAITPLAPSGNYAI
jgi:hypothetical protein